MVHPYGDLGSVLDDTMMPSGRALGALREKLGRPLGEPWLGLKIWVFIGVW